MTQMHLIAEEKLYNTTGKVKEDSRKSGSVKTLKSNKNKNSQAKILIPNDKVRLQSGRTESLDRAGSMATQLFED